MTLLDAVRDRLSTRNAAARSDSVGAEPAADSQAPFPGYDALDDREVMGKLADHSQADLSKIWDYERSHKDRVPVLNKLHYMRGREPIAGYDALSTEEAVAAVRGADRSTLKRIRAYERKFSNRPKILDAVVPAMHQRKTSEPAKPPPGYQPMSAEKA